MLREAVQKKNCIFLDIVSNMGGGSEKNLIEKMGVNETKNS